MKKGSGNTSFQEPGNVRNKGRFYLHAPSQSRKRNHQSSENIAPTWESLIAAKFICGSSWAPETLLDETLKKGSR